MHEASVAQNLLSIISARAIKEGAQFSATKVVIAIGEFRNVDPESLKFAFDSIRSEYKNCADCQIEIRNVPGKAVCVKQNHVFHPAPATRFACPLCGSGLKEFCAGEELDIEKIILSTSAKAPDCKVL